MLEKHVKARVDTLLDKRERLTDGQTEAPDGRRSKMDDALKQGKRRNAQAREKTRGGRNTGEVRARREVRQV